jgi:hypothetical protein
MWTMRVYIHQHIAEESKHIHSWTKVNRVRKKAESNMCYADSFITTYLMYYKCKNTIMVHISAFNVI